MHFHYAALCMNCACATTFETPIPNVLIMADMCRYCGWNDMVGRDGRDLCLPCRQAWLEQVKQEHLRMLGKNS
jgi:nitrous oxide reductase accessory protein NosL